MASHAYHLVCLAQEKAETQDKIDEALKKLAVEETELEGLQSAVAVMKNSNVKYRASTFGIGQVDDSGCEELRALRDQAGGNCSFQRTFNCKYVPEKNVNFGRFAKQRTVWRGYDTRRREGSPPRGRWKPDCKSARATSRRPGRGTRREVSGLTTSRRR